MPFDGSVLWSPGVRLGYVPQKIAADRQMPLFVRDLLEAKAHFLKLPRNAVHESVERVGLTLNLLNSSIGAISGGQFQKVLIAYALLGDPDVLLFDEPTASLDELEEEHVYQLMEQLKKVTGLTILLVSHDLSIVQCSADLVLCLSKGGPCIGKPEQILTQEVLENAYNAPLQYYRHHHHEMQP